MGIDGSRERTRSAQQAAAFAIVALLVASAVLPAVDAARGGRVPFTPRYADEQQNASITTPCCTFVFFRVNATDPDGSGFYDSANTTANGNGTTPRNVSVTGYRDFAPRVVHLPNATWFASVNITGYDSYISDSFDHTETDVNLTIEHPARTVGLRIMIRCVDNDPAVPSTESCSAS